MRDYGTLRNGEKLGEYQKNDFLWKSIFGGERKFRFSFVKKKLFWSFTRPFYTEV